jgi:hypothetical protein
MRLLNVERHEPTAGRIGRRFLIAYPVEEAIQDGRSPVAVRVFIVVRCVFLKVSALRARAGVVQP